MKKLIFSSLLGFALVAFTGCTTGNDASVSKCNGAKKCQSNSKCGDAKQAAKKCDSTKKCASSGKCGK